MDENEASLSLKIDIKDKQLLINELEDKVQLVQAKYDQLVLRYKKLVQQMENERQQADEQLQQSQQQTIKAKTAYREQKLLNDHLSSFMESAKLQEEQSKLTVQNLKDELLQLNQEVETKRKENAQHKKEADENAKRLANVISDKARENERMNERLGAQQAQAEQLIHELKVLVGV